MVAQSPNYLWAKSAGGTSDEFGRSVSTDALGNVYVIGTFQSISLTLGTAVLTNAGSYDMFIAKYDPSGNVLWAKSSGGTSYEGAQSVSIDALGNLYVVGYFLSPTITFGATVLTNTGGSDMFIAKLGTTAGIEENLLNEAVTVYPNPSSGKFILQSSTLKIQKIEIINVAGEKIYSSKINSDKSEIDLSKQPKGIYFIRASSEKGSSTQKLIIQ